VIFVKKSVNWIKTRPMGNLAISNKVLDKYFNFLKNLDNETKKPFSVNFRKKTTLD
jgi:hypothetical protein